MKSLRCEEHPSRYYTNFCAASQCMAPLCPECLPTHLRRKRCDSTFLEPIELVYQRAMLNGDRCHKELIEQVSLMKERQSRLVIDSHQRNQLALKEYRQKLQQLIHQHFDMLERQMKALQLQIGNDQRLMRTLSKYDTFREEVDRMRNDLNNGANLSQALRILVNLDLKAFVQNIKQQTQFVATEVKPPLLNIETSMLQEVRECLGRGINFKEAVSLPVNTVLGQPPVTNLHRDKEILDFSINQDVQPILSAANDDLTDRHAITVPDYFSRNCQFNLLHSFEPLTKFLYIVPLQILNEGQEMHIHRSELSSGFPIKTGSKSIITPDGDIYVFGGINTTSSTYEFSISKLMFSQNSLVDAGRMQFCRANASLCYCDGYIYILNGQSPGGQIRQCDRYNIKTGLSEIVAPSILAVSRATACTFNCRFIFRFSGVDSKGNQVGAIERYDIRRNAWEMINPTFAIGIPPNILTNFSWKPQCLAVQINPREILFTCGSLGNLCNTGTAILTEIAENSYEIRSINLASLPSEGFFTQPIIYNQIVHSIQVEPNKRKYNILLSDSNKWTVLS